MNEIQKFKEGRKILKGQYGLDTHEVMGETVNGERVAYVNIPGKGYIAVSPTGKAYSYKADNSKATGLQFTPINLTNYDREHIFKATQRSGGMTALSHFTADKVAKYWAAQGAPKPVAKPAAKPVAKEANTPADTQQNAAVTNSTPVSTGKSARQRPDYAGNFAGMDFTDEEKQYMTNAGFDPTNAKSVQQFILSQTAGANLGARRGAGIADGLWGNKSKEAFQELRNKGIFTPKEPIVDATEPEPKPEAEPVIDAPDPFGYKTSNTYEGNDFASRMKGMGIKSNADLINFMHNSGKEGWKGDAWQTQFRSDVDKALGGDYSDANIRKVFKTQGKWGRGFMSRGDFGDFQNALQTNAGAWNGAYEQKQSDARMDAARQQLAAKRAQQYTEQNSIKLKPLQMPAGMNINHGPMYYKSPAAASTLGDAGAGTMSPQDDWMQFAVQSGYLPQQ